MNVSMDFETKNLQKAFRLYAKATQTDEADILNRAGRNIAFRAAGATPRSRSAKIKSELYGDGHLAWALTSIQLKKRGVGILKKPGFRKEVSRFVTQRASSAGYMRAGWSASIAAFGGKYKGKKNRKANGDAKLATARHLVATLSNNATDIDKVGQDALRQAVAYVAADMRSYAEKKLAKRAREMSAR
jgi:hypothetical protein